MFVLFRWRTEMTNTTRKIRTDLTKEELERLEKYGSLEFKSAGTKRQLPPNYQDNGDGTFSMDW